MDKKRKSFPWVFLLSNNYLLVFQLIYRDVNAGVFLSGSFIEVLQICVMFIQLYKLCVDVTIPVLMYSC